MLADLEKDFTVTRDGKQFKELDFNFWGVTFARRPGRFYATLRTGDKTYLMEGDLRTRRLECCTETSSARRSRPIQQRVAYKKWLGGRWRLHVLDLATMKETALAEERPVDDQVEWLDDEHVLYGLSTDIWTVPADGTGSPEKVPVQGSLARRRPELTALRTIFLALACAAVVAGCGSKERPEPPAAAQPAPESSEVPIVRSRFSEIYVTDPAGRKVDRLTKGNGLFARDLSWSATGGIAFSQAPPNDFARLFVVKGDGRGRREVPTAITHLFHPTWSPDARRSP